MKTIILVVAILFLTGMAMADVTLDTPISLQPQATKVIVDKIVWDVDDVHINADLIYVSAIGEVLKRDNCFIVGTDYNQVVNNLVDAADIGKRKAVLFKLRVQNKCKNLLNITGTEN